MRDRSDIDRRRLLALSGGAAGGALFPLEAIAQQARRGAPPQRAPAEVSGSSAAGPGRAFFTSREFAILDELAEMIIPADANSGGARAAMVAEFLDRRVGESVDPAFRQGWREDLAEIDRMSQAVSGRSFVDARPEQRSRLLTLIARNEGNPKTTGESSFGSIKWQVTFVYYKTRIGIHDELKYQGNQILEQFEGFEPWKT